MDTIRSFEVAFIVAGVNSNQPLEGVVTVDTTGLTSPNAINEKIVFLLAFHYFATMEEVSILVISPAAADSIYVR